MDVWEADFYKGPLIAENGQILWELLICDRSGAVIHEAVCPQKQANSDWLVTEINQAGQGRLPDQIWVFRPQSVSLLTAAAKKLGVVVKATRHTPGVKKALSDRSRSFKLELPPPLPLPEDLWGDEWRFASIPAGDLVDLFSDRPIPILEMPEFLFPFNLGLASNLPIPGIVIYGGKKSMTLARWLAEVEPAFIQYLPTEVGSSGGLVLESGLVERWIVATFEDTQVAEAAQSYELRKQSSLGLHFLLVQPDDSGMTYSGFWLLTKSGD